MTTAPRTSRVDDLRARLRQIQLTLQASPWRAALIGALTVLGAIASGGAMVALGLVVGGVADAVAGDAGGSTLWPGIALLAASLIAGPIIEAAVSILSVSLDQQARIQRNDRLARTLLRPRGIGHLDAGGASARGARLLEEARNWQILGATGNTLTVITTRLGAVIPVILVALWNVWIALLLVITARVLSTVWLAYLSRLVDALGGDRIGDDQRRTRYMFRVAGGAAAAKEVRLFGLLPWLGPRLAGYERGQAMVFHGIKGARAADVAAVAAALVLLATALLAVHDALVGSLDVGRLAIVLAAMVTVMDALGPLGDAETFFLRAGQFEREVDALDAELRAAERGGEVHARTGADRAEVPCSPGSPYPSAAIRIRDLTFRYPGQESDVLAGMDLTIPAGQSVGVVGVNGAGKSTLMSLVAGLEAPTAGTVDIGGVAAAVPEEGAPRVAVILQDFSRYPLDVRDNVMLGRRASDAATRDGLVRAGGGEILERFDRDLSGLDTRLSPGLAGGTDVSGGQWQRLAMARALAAVDSGAQVLVLDEPTSALDVRAEAALFDDFLAVTRGVTTLLVSHRLSSVRRADRIIVIDGGGVAEDGTHEDLLAAGGIYAQMFTLQAARFADAGDGRNAGDDRG